MKMMAPAWAGVALLQCCVHACVHPGSSCIFFKAPDLGIIRNTSRPVATLASVLMLSLFLILKCLQKL
uniref:Secreted protein n=1 Tax=Kalanchoe fedtschenkoi TaxID=63787 RepID=A0A7N0V810_KALFE